MDIPICREPGCEHAPKRDVKIFGRWVAFCSPHAEREAFKGLNKRITLTPEQEAAIIATLDLLDFQDSFSHSFSHNIPRR